MSFDGDLYPTSGATSVLSTKGDIVRYNTERERYGIGSANQILQVKSNLPSWETVDLADTVLTTAGDVLYENNTPELARLPKGSDADVLTLASGLPSWSAPAGGGAWTFLETFTQGSSATYMDCELSSPFVYSDNNSLALTWTFKGDLSDTGCGVGLRYANSGTSFLTSAYYNIGTFNSDSTGLTKLFYSNYDGIPLLSDDTVGNGVGNLMVVHGGMRFYDSVVQSGSHWLKPFTYWTTASAFSSSQTGFCYHEDASNRTTLSAFRFAMSEDNFSVTGTNKIDADSQVTFWSVGNT